MKLPKNAIGIAKELYKSYKESEIGNKADKEQSLKLIIEEQRRNDNFLIHIYNRMRATEGLLLTASFGIIGYLYYKAPAGSKATIAERLSMPSQDYGKVIYCMAAVFFTYGVLKLMLNVFGKNPWETTYESKKTDYPSNYLGTLRYVKKRYDDCHKVNSKAYFSRKDELTFLFFCILISATILVVIKTLK